VLLCNYRVLLCLGRARKPHGGKQWGDHASHASHKTTNDNKLKPCGQRALIGSVTDHQSEVTAYDDKHTWVYMRHSVFIFTNRPHTKQAHTKRAHTKQAHKRSSMKINVSPEELQGAHDHAVEGSIMGALIGTGASAAASALLWRFSPVYRQYLSPSGKVALVVIAGCAGMWIGGKF